MEIAAHRRAGDRAALERLKHAARVDGPADGAAARLEIERAARADDGIHRGKSRDQFDLGHVLLGGVGLELDAVEFVVDDAQVGIRHARGRGTDEDVPGRHVVVGAAEYREVAAVNGDAAARVGRGGVDRRAVARLTEHDAGQFTGGAGDGEVSRLGAGAEIDVLPRGVAVGKRDVGEVERPEAGGRGPVVDHPVLGVDVPQIAVADEPLGECGLAPGEPVVGGQGDLGARVGDQVAQRGGDAVEPHRTAGEHMDVLGVGVAIHAQGVAVVASRSDGAARHMTVKVQITVDVDVLDVYVAVNGARHPAAVHVEIAVGVGVDVGVAADLGSALDVPGALPFDGAAQHVVEDRAGRGGETAQIHPGGPVERAAAQNGHVLEVGARGGADVAARVDGGVRHHHGGVVDGEVLRVDVAGRGGAVRDRAADEGPFGQRVVGGLTGVGVRHFLYLSIFRFNGYRFKGSRVANPPSPRLRRASRRDR